MVRDELTPRRIEKLTGKQIHSVSCGGFHTIAVTENGSIYSWGLGGTFDIETHSMFCVSGMMLKGKKFVVCFSLLSEIIQEKHPHVGFCWFTIHLLLLWRQSMVSLGRAETTLC